jgi:hypothetical protein
MISVFAGLLAVAALPGCLLLLRHWPRLMCGAALAGCGLPLLLPTSAPMWRTLTAVATSIILIKSLIFAAGHVRPRGKIDFLFFMGTLLPVVRWETPLRPEPRRAVRAFLTALFQLGLLGLLVLMWPQLDAHSPIHLIFAQVGLYLFVAGLCNLALVKFSLRGLDHEDAFNNPFASLTPGEFWGRRWNTAVSHLLHRYVFLPAGGRRHPLRGIFAAFAVSGAYHELLFDLGTLKFNGGMLGYFTLQGGLVAVTSRSHFVRRLARDLPVLAWFLTIVVMLTTGILFVRGMDGVDLTDAWRRVFGPS